MASSTPNAETSPMATGLKGKGLPMQASFEVVVARANLRRMKPWRA